MNFNRPISPHLTIYRMELTMLFSIMHRITGAALSVAILFFIILLKLFSFNASSYYIYSFAYFLNEYSNIFLLLIAFCILFALVYHMLTGIRHLIWDTGNFLEIRDMNMSVYIIAGLTFFLTLLLWILF